ncbi:MAG TPA: ankyrin repeat domain-containing protein [Alphaproteobacteria bacterium]|jgi:hypothetical protein
MTFSSAGLRLSAALALALCAAAPNVAFAQSNGPAPGAAAPARQSSSALGRQLIAATDAGNAAEAARLLAAGAELEWRDGRQRTALMAATQRNNVEIARLLIARGADVNAKDNNFDSPYLLAGASGYLDILKLTLANGANLKSLNRFGGTALIPACERGHVEVVATLIAAGVAVDQVNRLGWTCLLEAIILGDGGPRQTEIVRRAVAAGANVNLADGDGVTPLAHATKRGYADIVAILRSKGAR